MKRREEGVSAQIRQFIKDLEPGSTFSVRQFVHYASRAAIDQCLGLLTRNGTIWRCANGVYAKPGPVDALSIARTKSLALGKWLPSMGEQPYAWRGDKYLMVLALGPACSFMYGDVEVYFVNKLPRQDILGVAS